MRRFHLRSIVRFGAVLAVLLLASATCAQATAGVAAAPAPGDSLRLDPAVRTGVLPNGLRYFIRQNHKPENRVSLRLALTAGSNMEADDQRGLAHLCEHMNFDGSTHFKPEELVAYLESIGIHFGYDANAYTSFDETIYILDVPTDRDTLLDRGMTVLADFSGAALLTDAQLEKERKVVMEEWRQGRGADERIWRQQLPVYYHGSRYADRVPIGLPEVIQNAPAARVRDFYRTWYRPDRMAVIAVGDLEPARMDSLVRAHFGGLQRPATPSTAQPPVIPLHDETLVSVATDRELSYSSVSLLYKHPHRARLTVADYRRGVLENLYGAMFNARFSEISHRADPPFQAASTGAGSLGRNLDTWQFWVSVGDGGIPKGLAAVLDEIERVRRFGFLPSELSRAREQLRQQDATRFAERDKQESSGLAGRYISTYLTGEPSIGVEAAHALVSSLLDGVTLEEINALTPQLVHDGGRIVLASAPEKAGVPVPAEAELRAALAPSARGAITAWEDHTAGRVLMPQLPRPGKVRSRRVIEPLGVTVLRLSNGVEVWLKPTDFKADEILIGAHAMGGISRADSAAVLTAAMSSWLVPECGFGGFTGTEMQKLLAGKIASMRPYASAYTQGITGRARPADLETALQLLHLDFTQPTGDSSAFVSSIARVRTYLANRANSPDQVFGDTVSVVNSGNFYMDRPTNVAELDRVHLGDALAFYRGLYANAADFTFFVVGSFQVDSIVPLLERYVGSLPSAGHPTSAYVPRGPRYPTGTRTVHVRRGVEQKSDTEITFFTGAGLDELDLHRARASAAILQERLRQSLRELLGGTYGASVGFATREPLPGYTTMTIEFGCDPARVDTLVAAALADVRRLRESGPSADDVKKEQEIERRELEVSLKQNGAWFGSLQKFHEEGWDPLRLLKRRERIDALTPEALHASFVKYFPLDRYTVITLLPEVAAGARP